MLEQCHTVVIQGVVREVSEHFVAELVEQPLDSFPSPRVPKPFPQPLNDGYSERTSNDNEPC